MLYQSRCKLLTQLSNSELASRMFDLTKRYGELSLWMAESTLKIQDLITRNPDAPIKSTTGEIGRQLDLKHGAELESLIVLSDLKKIELEMDRRVCGAV